ncbi:MAG: NYN domain-containing protein [Patescibacteria group bacterium]
MTNNYAFIDGQNLYFSLKSIGWKVDYKRFRVYLKEKYSITRAYIFVGFLPDYQQFYNFLQSAGFIIVFKPVLESKDGKIKGNCDAELVLQTMIDLPNFEKALIVSGDGDFYCLVKYLKNNGKLLKVLAPAHQSCSSLLFQMAGKDISFVEDLRTKVEYKRKGPHKDGTL